MAEEATAPVPPSSDKVEETTEAVGSNDVATTSEAAAAPSGDEPINGATGADKAADLADENAPADDATNDATATATNGATDSAKKNSKRKSTGATVPEHKNKKLNRKKSMPNLNLDAKAGEYWFIHMKGYPPWPGIICDEEMLPESLLKTRPVSAMRTDGTYREDFMPGGKSARDRRYPVMFLGTNEFGWHVNTDIAPLDMDEVKAVVEKDEQGKRSKALWEAYKIAAEGHDLKHFKEVLAEHEQYAREIAEEKAARDAEKAEKAAKKAERAEKAATKGEKAAKRKSKGAADGEEEEEEDVDMEDAEDDEAPKKAKGSKKRKKDADSDGETAKPAKTPKIKVNGPKTPATDSAKPKKTKPAKKAKEEVAEAEPEKEEEPELSPEEKLAKREKGVLYLRHKLQKGLVTREEPPKEDEMPAMAEHFKTLEQYTKLEATIIKNTKIHKVLKAIIKVNSIPRDDEFKFKERSHKLLEEWTATLQAEADSGVVAEGPPAVITNGVNHEEAAEDAKAAEEGDLKSAPAQEAKAAEEVIQETEKKESEPKIEKELEADKSTEPADTTMEDVKEAAAETAKEETTTES